jgi:tripartite-type tricarboxylate transporter receptor subunit TctC
MRRWIRAAAALLIACSGPLAAAYSDKPVRMVVPYPAGGPIDIATRMVADRLGKAWGQTVIVDNRPGASGAIGTEAVMRSTPDGHTLLVHSPIMLATELARPAVAYRTLRDFAPVPTLLASPVVYMASQAAPKGGVREILAELPPAPQR